MESVADGMESRPKGEADTRQTVMPYALREIPYNSLCELMPYQALRDPPKLGKLASGNPYFGLG